MALNTDYPNNQTLHLWKEEAVRKQVAVIGGGIAGLKAVETLFADGIKDVVLLEAQDRLGGRVRTIRDRDSGVFEEGAQWIHGAESNPIFRIAQHLNALNPEVPSDEYIIKSNNGSTSDANDPISAIVDGMLSDAMVNGELEEYYGQGYGQYYIDRFQKEVHFEKENCDQRRRAWLHFTEQRVKGDEGTNSWQDISARDADQYVDYGDDFLWADGYDTIINYLTRNIPPYIYLLNTSVVKIFWNLDDTDQVLLVTGDDKKFLVDFVICSVSVGFLKKNHHETFDPPLPTQFSNNLKGIELGNSNKIIASWSTCWWEEKDLNVRILWDNFDLPQEMDWLHGIVEIMQLIPGKPILGAFVSGEYSVQMESLSEKIVEKHFLFLLEKLKLVTDIPELKFFRRTQWNSNPWTEGSYGSFINLEGEKNGIHSRASFRRPLRNGNDKNVILWAGEHTHDTRYGTVDGAFRSGQREAMRIIRQIK